VLKGLVTCRQGSWWAWGLLQRNVHGSQTGEERSYDKEGWFAGGSKKTVDGALLRGVRKPRMGVKVNACPSSYLLHHRETYLTDERNGPRLGPLEPPRYGSPLETIKKGTMEMGRLVKSKGRRHLIRHTRPENRERSVPQADQDNCCRSFRKTVRGSIVSWGPTTST